HTPPAVSYTLSLHDALPICLADPQMFLLMRKHAPYELLAYWREMRGLYSASRAYSAPITMRSIKNETELESFTEEVIDFLDETGDRKSTRLNSSHSQISYAV